MLVLYEVALCAVAMLLAAGVVAPRASVVTNLMVELGESRSGVLRDALAHVLRDPSLEVAYHSMDTGDYRDQSGRVVSVPPTVGGRATTLVERESRPFAVLVHDASVLDEPALVDAVATATRLSTANTTLTEELRSQIGEAAAARRRLMLADVEERRRLECRMQDGVEDGVSNS